MFTLYAEREPDALEPIDDRGPDVVAQAYFARDEEHALTVDDVVRRRTTLAIRGLADDRTRSRVARALDPEHHRRHEGLAELAIR